MSQYYTVLTALGEKLLAQALAAGQPLKLTTIAVGDGNGSVPKHTTASTKLINEKYRAAVTTLTADKANPSQFIAEQILPETVGGFWVREVALYDNGNNLIAIGNCPETYKPKLTDGAGGVLSVKLYVAVSNVNAVEIKMTPASVYVTEQHVNDHFVKKTGDTVTGSLSVTGELSSRSANSFRMVNGNYSSFWRNDGRDLYLMLTNKNDPFGNYNDLRPMAVNLQSGELRFGHNIRVQQRLMTESFVDLNTQTGQVGRSKMLTINSDEEIYNLPFGTRSICDFRNYTNPNSPIKNGWGYIEKNANRDSVVRGVSCSIRSHISPREWLGATDSLERNAIIWAEYLTTANTAIDANGFIKRASPVIRLFNDPTVVKHSQPLGFKPAGCCVYNREAEGVTAKRIAMGHYQITGSLGFAKEGWTIETPEDENGNKLLFVKCSVDDNQVITVKTYKKRLDLETANVVAGEPMDILDGRWIDLRLDMPQQPEITPEPVDPKSDVTDIEPNKDNTQ